MIKIISSFLILITIYILQSCHSNTGPVKDSLEEISADEYKALGLLKANCFTCHDPDFNSVNRVAPAMSKVREHYLVNGKSKEQFFQDIKNFMENPSEANAVMTKAVSEFGLMPKMNINLKDLKIISDYLYDTDLASTAWLEKWTNTKADLTVQVDSLDYEALGLNYAMQTKAVLGKYLMTAIKEKGTEYAVDFCSTKAIHLTDSMSSVFNIRIKRVTDKPRNPQNKCNDTELTYIKDSKIKLANGEKLSSKLIESDNSVIAFYPIETNKMCVQCHGTVGKEIKQTVYKKIKEKYPNDLATGYNENELRGIWVVEMDK